MEEETEPPLPTVSLTAWKKRLRPNLGRIEAMQKSSIDVKLQQRVLKNLRKELRKGKDPLADAKWTLSQRIELAICNWSKDPEHSKILGPKQTYIQKAFSVLSNLSHVRDDILSGKLSPSDMVYMTHHELNPQLRKEYLEKQIARENAMQKLKNHNSGLFPCRKCGSKNTEYTQMQIRSADEPMTNFHVCLDCGKRWKS